MSTRIGPWPLGIDNLTPDAELPPGALRVADDVLLQEGGTAHSGQGARLAVPAPGLACLWAAPNGQAYGVMGSQVVQVTRSSVIPLGDVGANGRACFAEHAGQVIAATRSGLYQVGAEVAPLGLPAPAFQVRAVEHGGLDAGRYGVAVASLRGAEEFGLSAILFVDVPQGGGLSLDVSGDGMTRIYRTSANGAELYRAVDAPAGLPDFLLGAGKLGAMPTGRNLELMPGGQLLRSWQGRLLVANGRTLAYSQPMRPALWDGRHNFVRFPTPITMIAPVRSGVFVADQQRVYFLAGTDPEQWSSTLLDAAVPVHGTGSVVPGNLFTDVPNEPVALWLSRFGFVLGLPDGQLVMPQASRLRLNDSLSGSLAVLDRRLFALAL